VILLPSTPIESAVAVAELCRKALEKSVVKVKETESFHVYACFGVSSTDHVGYDYLDLFDQADKALYQAKRNGKNQVRTVFTL
jgi:diguanylate cyclase (GGDEF)-like protein